MPIEFSDKLLNINRIRIFETNDIFERLGFISADQVSLNNYPLKPYKIFNSSILIDRENLEFYARGVFDYYKYVSSVIKFEIPINEVLAKEPLKNRNISGRLILIPSREEDFWGVEDPRAFYIDGKKYIAYTGRTKWYYKEDPKDNSKIDTLTVVAKENNKDWVKIGYLSFRTHIFEELKSIKNCVVVKNKKMYSLCRIHTHAGKFYTTISELKNFENGGKFDEIIGLKSRVVITSAPFEKKNGWGAPPIKVGNKEFLVFLHGVDNQLYKYRVFAALLKEDETLEIVGITPHYIMEPKKIQEMYGDRPYVIFPCGAQIIDDSLLISYGAADSFVGIARADLSSLLSELDKNRID